MEPGRRTRWRATGLVLGILLTVSACHRIPLPPPPPEPEPVGAVLQITPDLLEGSWAKSGSHTHAWEASAFFTITNVGDKPDSVAPVLSTTGVADGERLRALDRWHDCGAPLDVGASCTGSIRTSTLVVGGMFPPIEGTFSVAGGPDTVGDEVQYVVLPPG